MRALAAAVAVILVAPACHTAGTAQVDRATSACLKLGGRVGSHDLCDIHDTTTKYTIAMRFPTGYPDQDAVTDYLARERKDFIDWVENYGRTRTFPAGLDVIGNAYDSDTTRSLILSIGSDTGVHPVTTFKAFNYSLATRSPLAFEALFKPDSDPMTVLKPIVWQQVRNRDPKAAAAVNGLTAASFRQFAITDDAIIFFFNQDGFLPHDDGPLEVSVPRSDLARILNWV